MRLKSAEDELGKGAVLVGRFFAKAELWATRSGAKNVHGLRGELHKQDLAASSQENRPSEAQAGFFWPFGLDLICRSHGLKTPARSRDAVGNEPDHDVE